MRLFEFTSSDNFAELAALAQFLVSRANDTVSNKKISTDAFVNLAADLGISLTKDSLHDIVKKPPLSNLINQINGNEILFKGNSDIEDNSARAAIEKKEEKAQEVVNKMSKRALSKRD